MLLFHFSIIRRIFSSSQAFLTTNWTLSISKRRCKKFSQKLSSIIQQHHAIHTTYQFIIVNSIRYAIMNLSSAAFAIALSAAASTATVSAYSFSAKASKASSKATKAKSPKTKASKGSYSYSMSMSLPNCKRAEEPYDTRSGEITFDVNELLTPEAGETFTFFDYSSASANYMLRRRRDWHYDLLCRRQFQCRWHNRRMPL